MRRSITSPIGTVRVDAELMSRALKAMGEIADGVVTVEMHAGKIVLRASNTEQDAKGIVLGLS